MEVYSSKNVRNLLLKNSSVASPFSLDSFNFYWLTYNRSSTGPPRVNSRHILVEKAKSPGLAGPKYTNEGLILVDYYLD